MSLHALARALVLVAPVYPLVLAAPVVGLQAAEPAAVTLDGAWARASAAPSGAGAAFLTIHNTGPADRLLAAAAPVAVVTEIHTHIHDNGVMRMRALPALDIPAHADTILRPGGLHVMLIDLKAPLQEGQRFPLDLTFERAGVVRVDVAVHAPGALGPGASSSEAPPTASPGASAAPLAHDPAHDPAPASGPSPAATSVQGEKQ